jgi:hypothetical protein
MPQRLSITFSPGQKQTSNGFSTTSDVVSDSPVYDFQPMATSGASQLSSSLRATASSPSILTSIATSVVNVEPEIPSGAILPPPLKPAVPGRVPRLKTLQLWEGTVTELREGGFVAVLSDKTNSSNPDEQAVFDNSEISPGDHALIMPGSSFYWIIGAENTFGGQVRNVSTVQFRRVPVWPQKRLERAAERARHLRESLREAE